MTVGCQLVIVLLKGGTMQEHKCLATIDPRSPLGRTNADSRIVSADAIPELLASNFPAHTPICITAGCEFKAIRYCHICGRNVEAEFAPKIPDTGVDFF